MTTPLSIQYAPDVAARLVPNAVDCSECQELFDGVDPLDAEEGICPMDDRHAGMPVHVSSEPISGDAEVDREHYHFGRHRYEYALEMP
jgi:hypothetical protein